MSDSVWPHRRQPTRLPRPWDSPSKNTGVGCHFLLQCMEEKSESEVAQSCPTLATPWTAAYQAPPSMGFSRQKYWSGVPLPSLKHIYISMTNLCWYTIQQKPKQYCKAIILQSKINFLNYKEKIYAQGIFTGVLIFYWCSNKLAQISWLKAIQI